MTLGSGQAVNRGIPPQNKRTSRSIAKTLAIGLVIAFVVTFAATMVFIIRQAHTDEAQPADAIVVFGAAEYAGRPSPVYRARLDHAYELFQRGLAPIVITTGGAGADPTFTEGGVGRDYLLTRGIPDRCLIAETQGDDTAESAQRVAAILRANRMGRVLAVSDAYHVFRIKRLLRKNGIVAYGSPRPGSLPKTRSARLTAALRESASYMFWRLYPSWFPQ